MGRSTSTAVEFLPEAPSLTSLRRAAEGCTACELYKSGTQVVFGEGLKRARLMLVGEQPGDREDLAGKPFVGPAGRLLDQALVQAGISRHDAYVTNVVKHFKWVAKGKRRIHKKPNADEIMACMPWLDAELEVVDPQIVIALGATAAQALLGRSFKVTRRRGEILEWDRGPAIMATVHPSSILRLRDRSERDEAMTAFIEDLAGAAERLAQSPN